MKPVVIPDPVRAAAAIRPEAPAIVAPDETVTWADLECRVAAVAAQFRGDLASGDRLAVYRPTDVLYLVLLLAAFRARVVLCPINTRQPVSTVPALLDRIGCTALVAAPDPAWKDRPILDLDVAGESVPTPEPTWALSETATLVFTSGSTGTPKAALHTLGNHVASARGLAEVLPLGPGDRWLLDLPLYHVGGLAILIRCVLAGATVVLPAPERSAEDVIAECGVTHVSFVATQLGRVLRRHPDKLAGVKAVLLGGSAIPPGLVARSRACDLPIHTSYGLTEMSSTVTVTPPGASADVLQTSGTVIPGREVRLADDREILVRGAALFAGYADGAVVQRPAVGDGWFPTGDLGVWAEVDGVRMLRVVGRKDNLFISGGENVQPEEVEAALGRLLGVQRGVVVPVADAEFGQRPVAFVEADTWTPDVWREALLRTLPAFKVPVAFHPWPSDVREGMKVDRRRLAEAATRVRIEG